MAGTVSTLPKREYRLPHNRPAVRQRARLRAARLRNGCPRPLRANFTNVRSYDFDPRHHRWSWDDEHYLPLAQAALQAFQEKPYAPVEVSQPALDNIMTGSTEGTRQKRRAEKAILDLLREHEVTVWFSAKSEGLSVPISWLEPIVGWVGRDRRGQRIDLVTATIELSPRLA